MVNSLSDATGLPSSVITLRKAITTANSSSTPTTITFDPTVFSSHKTLILAQGALVLSNTKEAITITGPAAGVTVNGNFQGGVFEIKPKVNANFATLIVANGSGQYLDKPGLVLGGGILNSGTTTLNNVTVSNSESSLAPSNGQATEKGGGSIYNDGTMTLTNGALTGASAEFFRRGGKTIHKIIGTMTLTNVTITGGSILAFGAGGILNDGTITLTNATVSENSGDIGGIENNGKATLTNVTFYANNGVAIENDSSGTMTLTNATISGNAANDTDVTHAAGIETLGKLNIANSIVAQNGSSRDVSGFVNSFGNNLISEINGSFGWNAADLTGTIFAPIRAKLGAPAENGGPTETLLPLTGSPAINAGSNVLIPHGITTDQRGLPRIFGSSVDIGAVEVQSRIVVTPQFPPALRVIDSATTGQSDSFGLGSFTATEDWRPLRSPST